MKLFPSFTTWTQSEHYGQPLVLIKHRATDKSFEFVEALVSCLNSKQVYLTAKEHDRITADTQAVTHAAFLSMESRGNW